LIHHWFIIDSSLIHNWFIIDSSLIHHWFIIDSSLICHWFIIDLSLISHWYVIDSSLIPHWFVIDSSLICHWFVIDSSLIHHWFLIMDHWFPIIDHWFLIIDHWFLIIDSSLIVVDSSLIRHWFVIDLSLIRHWFVIDSSSIPHWFIILFRIELYCIEFFVTKPWTNHFVLAIHAKIEGICCNNEWTVEAGTVLKMGTTGHTSPQWIRHSFMMNFLKFGTIILDYFCYEDQWGEFERNNVVHPNFEMGEVHQPPGLPINNQKTGLDDFSGRYSFNISSKA
jgi:hypothetical protein